MGYFEKVTKPERVQLNDEYWVDLAANVSYDETRAMAKTFELDPSALDIKFSVKCVSAWNLDDAEGKLLDITEENLGKIPVADFMKIQEKVMLILGLEKKGVSPS